jgi:hypothetical protein
VRHDDHFARRFAVERPFDGISVRRRLAALIGCTKSSMTDIRSSSGATASVFGFSRKAISDAHRERRSVLIRQWLRPQE